MTKTEVEGIVEKALRAHERRCSDDRHELERRIDHRLDKLERKLSYYAGGIAFGVIIIQIGIKLYFS